MSFARLSHGLADHVFSDIETEAREVRAYAESTERWTTAQVDEVVAKWRAMSARDRARALANMREQRRVHEVRVKAVVEAAEAARPKQEE